MNYRILALGLATILTLGLSIVGDTTFIGFVFNTLLVYLIITNFADRQLQAIFKELQRVFKKKEYSDLVTYLKQGITLKNSVLVGIWYTYTNDLLTYKAIQLQISEDQYRLGLVYNTVLAIVIIIATGFLQRILEKLNSTSKLHG